MRMQAHRKARDFHLTVVAFLLAIICTAWAQGSFEYSAARSPSSLEYQQCKATHRCPMAIQQFDVESSRYYFASQRFAGGIQDPALAFFDFENWEAGTSGWQLNPQYAEEHPFKPPALNISLQNMRNLGQLRLEAAVDLFIDTTAGSMHYSENGANQTFLADPAAPAEVCAFVFESISINENVRIIVSGQQPLVLASTSSILLNSELKAHPATLGGFSGARAASTENGGVNENGATSGNQRVYQSTITSFADHIDEVQRVSAMAKIGHTPRGSFRLSLGGAVTHTIEVTATAETVKRRIEATLPDAGIVSVQRVDFSQSRIDWLVTFESAPGNIEQMTVDPVAITGVLASVHTDTVQEGNQVKGTFSLSWNGQHTADINVAATASEMQAALWDAFGRVGAQLIHVQRTAHANFAGEECLLFNCHDFGVSESGGHTYFVTIATDRHNVAFTRPADISSAFSADPVLLSVFSTNLMGNGSSVLVQPGHVGPAAELLPPHPFLKNSTFSLAFGGNGGTSAGRGGLGHSFVDPSESLNVSALQLPGGSGGCMGGVLPHDSLYFGSQASGHGGGGGGLFICLLRATLWSDRVEL